MRLSEDLRNWRAERPDEWTMDRFIQEATRLEAEVEKFTSTNKQSVPFSFDDIEEEFKGFAKSSYDYSLYACGALDMFNFIVAKLNSTRLS